MAPSWRYGEAQGEGEGEATAEGTMMKRFFFLFGLQDTRQYFLLSIFSCFDAISSSLSPHCIVSSYKHTHTYIHTRTSTSSHLHVHIYTDLDIISSTRTYIYTHLFSACIFDFFVDDGSSETTWIAISSFRRLQREQ